MTQDDINRVNFLAGKGGGNSDLIRQQEECRLEIQKKIILNEMELSFAKARAEMLSDISAQRELQKLNVEVTLGQRVKIVKERFGCDLSDETVFTVTGYQNIICREREEDKVLCLVIQNQYSNAKSAFFCYRKLEDSYINRKCNVAGIVFGFSHEKETRVRKLFLEKLMETASCRYIPTHHGWYQEEGEIKFAFPDELTWEEVEPYI